MLSPDELVKSGRQAGHSMVESVPPVSLLCRSRSTETGPCEVRGRGRESTSRLSVFVEACVSVGAVVLQVAKRLSSRSFSFRWNDSSLLFFSLFARAHNHIPLVLSVETAGAVHQTQ